MVLSGPKNEIVIALVEEKIDEMNLAYSLIEGTEIIQCTSMTDWISIRLEKKHLLVAESTFGFIRQVYSFKKAVTFDSLSQMPLDFLTECAIPNSTTCRYDPLDVRNYLYCYIDSCVPYESASLSDIIDVVNWFMDNVFNSCTGTNRSFDASVKLQAKLLELASGICHNVNITQLISNMPKKSAITDYIIYAMIRHYGNLNS